MEKKSVQSLAFILVSLVLLIVTAASDAVIYGNDEASIKRYIYQEKGRQLGDHVEVLAVQDHGPDRIAIFRLETKRPDDVWIVRFQKDEAGNYADYYGYIRGMLRDRRGIYLEHLSGLGGGDQTTYFAVWSTEPALAAIRFQFENGPEQTAAVTESPSLTLLEWPEGESHLSYFFCDADGREL